MLPKVGRKPVTFSVADECISHSATVNWHGNGSQSAAESCKEFSWLRESTELNCTQLSTVSWGVYLLSSIIWLICWTFPENCKKCFVKLFLSGKLCSWGPTDDGKTVDGPLRVASDGMRHGITYGRRGYGSIYVVASGNGGSAGDNCNYDGYANSIYTVTIGAVGEDGNMPYYAEECASMLAVTYSSGGTYGRNIVCYFNCFIPT